MGIALKIKLVVLLKKKRHFSRITNRYNIARLRKQFF